MGSYLSIVNNTEDKWTCKIEPDDAALKIAGVVVSVVRAAVTVIGTAGTATPVVSAVAANGAISVYGVASSAFTMTSATSAFGMTIAKGITENLIDQGYVTIAPGEDHQWGKMSLSLWQQGTCMRTTIADEKTVSTDTLYMRPIFSGATDNSDIGHEIQFWIDKFSVESTSVTGKTEQQKRHHHRHHKEGGEDDGRTVIFYANSTNTYDPNSN